MTETVEAFIGKLQAEGVEAGRAAAEKIRSEAEHLARQIITEAQDEAKRTNADAVARCEEIRSRSETELKLAARDVVVRLRETLNRALRGVLSTGVSRQLQDDGFLRELLRDLVAQYVRADLKGAGVIQINVSKEMRKTLAGWAIETIRSMHDAQGPSVDLHGTLRGAGFEYSVAEGTSEITVESVVNVLSELVSAELREILSSVVCENTQ